MAATSSSTVSHNWAWVLRDAVQQLENLIVRYVLSHTIDNDMILWVYRRSELDRKEEVERVARESSPSLSGSPTAAIGGGGGGGDSKDAVGSGATKKLEEKGALGREDVRTGLRLLQQWYAHVHVTDSSFVDINSDKKLCEIGYKSLQVRHKPANHILIQLTPMFAPCQHVRMYT
jgi:hypothetical protein